MAPLQRDTDGRLTLSRDWIPIIATLLGLLGGLGGTAGYQALVPARPDPFTGSDGRALEMRIQERLDKLDREGSRALQDCKARVQALESARGEIAGRLTRIEELLVELRVSLGIVAPRSLRGNHGASE